MPRPVLSTANREKCWTLLEDTTVTRHTSTADIRRVLSGHLADATIEAFLFDVVPMPADRKESPEPTTYKAALGMVAWSA